MDRSGAYAYVYAKACGIVSKSFVGKKSGRLFSVKTLGELWTLLFEEELPMVPEGLLAYEIERKARGEFISSFISLLSAFDKPEPVCLALLDYFNFENYKILVHALDEKQKDVPFFNNLGDYSTLNLAKWPSFTEMVRGTFFAGFGLSLPEKPDASWENMLDKLFYRNLWDSVNKIPSGQRDFAIHIIKNQIEIENISWALRLRVYFDMKREDIIPMLVFEDAENPSSKDVLGGTAVEALELPLDNIEAWKSWKFFKFLNPWSDSSLWSVDPRYFEQAGFTWLGQQSLKNFHRNPFSVNTLLCFFKIKQSEVSLIRTAAEGIRLQVSEKEMADFRGNR